MEHSAGYFPTMIVIAVLLVCAWLLDLLYLRKIAAGASPCPTDLLPKRYGIEITLFVLTFFVFFLLNNRQFVIYNNYSWFADALLNGRLDIPDMPAYLESVEFGGKIYMHFAPGPALLCLPFVLLFGISGFNTAYLCMLLGAGNAVLFYKVLERMEIGAGRRDRLWCTVFAIFGTVHCFLAAVGHSWFFGHVATWFFLLVSMFLVTSKNKKHEELLTFLAGFAFGLAVTCRLSNLLGGVFFAGYLLLKRERVLRSLLLFAAGAAIPGAFYMAYNYARFGTIMDKGYNLTFLKDRVRDQYDIMQALPKSEQLAFLNHAETIYGGPLQAKHIRSNLHSIFLLTPDINLSAYPYVIPTLAGVSLTVLSPALYFLVRAEWKDKLNWFLAAATVLASIPFLMNYGNGFAQFGMRYAMDFLPYMILLACMGLSRRGVQPWKTAIICYCILANMWGPIFWNTFY
ncbi:MAG: hypothetical protein FWE69_07545 [Clostridiales bacterium]|nr:hypothetical protein [Clostridiales bacterium]